MGVACGSGGEELRVNFRLGLPFVSFAPWTVCVCERDCVCLKEKHSVTSDVK